MNSIARFAVKNPVTVLMMVLGIVLLGFISFGKLGTDLFPDLNTPKIYIEVKAGEKPPEEIEKNYVDQIESLAMRQSDVVQVSSVSRQELLRSPLSTTGTRIWTKPSLICRKR